MKHSVLNLDQRLLKLTVCSWCVLLTVGLAVKLVLPIPTVTLLLDRSYCDPDQWQKISQEYARLYRQHQHQRLRLEKVVFFSNLSQTNYKKPPHPNVVELLTTYGQFDQQRQTTLEETYSNTTVLSCHKPLSLKQEVAVTPNYQFLLNRFSEGDVFFATFSEAT